MAIAMLIAGDGASEPVVGPEAVGQLARVGITRISVFADRSGRGVVLEGWAFDPAHIEDAIRAMFPNGSDGVRILREVELVAVAEAPNGRRTRCSTT